MLKKVYSGLALVAGVAIVSVVIARIFGKKQDDENDCNCCDKCCEV